MRGYTIKKMGWVFGVRTIYGYRENIYGYYETHTDTKYIRVNTLKRIVYKCSYVKSVSTKGDSSV